MIGPIARIAAWTLGSIAAVEVGKKVFSKSAPAPPGYFGSLVPRVQAKVTTALQTMQSPTELRQLGNGLAKSGASGAAADAHAKATAIEATQAPFARTIAETAAASPGSISLPGISLTPQGGTPINIPGLTIGPPVASSGPTSYQVASGDAPFTIAQRFGVTLSAFAKANGSKGARIAAGRIVAGETLALPAGANDLGARAKAKGIAI